MDCVVPQGRCFLREQKRKDVTNHLQVLIEWDCLATSFDLSAAIELSNKVPIVNETCLEEPTGKK